MINKIFNTEFTENHRVTQRKSCKDNTLLTAGVTCGAERHKLQTCDRGGNYKYHTESYKSQKSQFRQSSK